MTKALAERAQRATMKTRIEVIKMKRILQSKMMRDLEALNRLDHMIKADRWSKGDIVFLNQRLLNSKI